MLLLFMHSSAISKDNINHVGMLTLIICFFALRLKESLTSCSFEIFTHLPFVEIPDTLAEGFHIHISIYDHPEKEWFYLV